MTLTGQRDIKIRWFRAQSGKKWTLRGASAKPRDIADALFDLVTAVSAVTWRKTDVLHVQVM